MITHDAVFSSQRWKVISQILQRSDNDVKNRWNSKGYAHHRTILAISNLTATASLLNDWAADMTCDQRAAHATSLRLLEGIPSEILASFESNTDAPVMTRVKRETRMESEILGQTQFPVEMEAETVKDITWNEANPIDGRG